MRVKASTQPQVSSGISAATLEVPEGVTQAAPVGLRGANSMKLTPQFGVIAHVGDLSRAREPKGYSFEGAGLSVSRHPEAWTHIAKLGGYQTWVLRKENPAFYEVPAKLPKKVTAWLESAGFLEPTTEFCYEWFDEDLQETRAMAFATREEAEEEAGESGAEVFERAAWKFGPKGLDYWHATFGEAATPQHGYAEDFGVMFWAENRGYDGCWWGEDLDPVGLSAPRGVIFQSKLSEWAVGVADYPEGGFDGNGAERGDEDGQDDGDGW